MEIINIFPTCLGLSKLDRELTCNEFDFIKSLDKKKNKENSLSVNSYVLESDELKDIKEWISHILTNYFNKIYKPKLSTEIYITQSWVNYSKKGESHHKHSHPNSFLSAVFYIKSDENSGRIVFHKKECRELTIDTDDYNGYNANSYYMPVNDLELLIFPSNLIHSVETVETENERISLALNTFVKGDLGDINNLSKLLL
jgi:hypothetical protein